MRVILVLGSKSDLPHAQAIVNRLETFKIPSTVRIASAHKAPARLLEIIAQHDAADHPLVYIAIAGRSNALAGVLDGTTLNPVLTCPPYSEKFGGADLFSSLRLPSGITAPVVLEPEGVALAAAKILAMSDPQLRERIHVYKQDLVTKMLADDAALQEQTPEPH